eukprot:Tbor_TRINITY_DN3250_c0_g1::TRINITY_DN3250_c0_g1_i1::g.23675::m.23675/K01930/FPGS; folylpolyglutamate synthase
MKRTWNDVVSTVRAMTGRKPNASSKGFEYTRSILDHLCLTEYLDTLTIIHVAGTKGKGTTCTFASNLLEKSYNKKVGLFTSPHLFDVRERIQINNKFISKEQFTEYFFQVHEAIHKMTSGDESELDLESAKRENFFRFMFLLSLFIFKRENVDVAVIEVGIGGRLDTTNIINKPAVCGITALGMDHMDILGETIEDITREKAGIMKEGVICFSNTQLFHPSMRAILQAESIRYNAPLVFIDTDVFPFSTMPILKMTGQHFIENASLGLALARTVCGIQVSQPISLSESNTLMHVTMDGRSQEIDMRSVLQDNITSMGAAGSDYTETPILHSKSINLQNSKLFLDGAHNTESMRAMVESGWYFPTVSIDTSDRVVETPRKRIVILYSTRDPLSMLQGLVPYAQHIDRVIFALIPSPRQTSSILGAYEDDILRNIEFVKQCKVLMPSVPCFNCDKAFLQMQDIFDIIDVTSEETDDGDLKDSGVANVDNPHKGANILFTGSILFVGHVLKIIKYH